MRTIGSYLASFLPGLPLLLLIKNLLYKKLCGYQIGVNARIGRGTLLSGELILIGDNTVIGRSVRIGPGLRKVLVGDYCSIQEGTIIEGDDEIEIGDNCWIGRETLINVRRKVRIEDNVGIGMRSQLWTHGYFSETVQGYPSTSGEITIKKNAWLPPSVLVLPGVTIGENAHISTGSIVRKDIPDHAFAFPDIKVSLIDREKYRKNLSFDEKRNLLIEFLDDLLGPSQRSEPNLIVWKAHNDSAYLVDEIGEDIIKSIQRKKPGLVVSMRKVSEEVWRLAAASKVSLFDVESRLCTRANNRLGVKFRVRANDYLIRFRSIDKIRASDS